MALAEMKLEITNGRVIDAQIISEGICKLTIEVKTEEKQLDNTFGSYDDPDGDWN